MEFLYSGLLQLAGSDHVSAAQNQAEVAEDFSVRYWRKLPLFCAAFLNSLVYRASEVLS